MDISFDQITPYRNGKAGLIAGLCQQIGLDKIFDEFLTPHTGRPADIAYGVLAQMMLVTMADDHHPLSRISEYFKTIDIGSIFNAPIDLSKLNDDRFGGFLDLMHEADGAKIMSAVAVNAFNHYGIALSSVNFDTTSKIMWGEYETSEGTVGTIDITFGHSKQHRPDKKQMKLSMGTTQGVCIDGRIHSGNMSDKTYNVDNLERAAELKSLFKRDENPFFYIADSAAFTKEFLLKARSLNMDVITRMPDNILECKYAIEKTLDQLEALTVYEIPSSTTPSSYRILSDQCVYHDMTLNMAVCYSQKLEKSKTETIKKRVLKEREDLEKQLKLLSKRPFACLDDALIEIDAFNKQALKKNKYHTVSLESNEETIKRAGRPSKNPDLNTTRIEYKILYEIKKETAVIERAIKKECIFVVVSTNLDFSGYDILREYKTQGAVERKFQFLKSPQFVNSLYVDSPRRVESLGYLMLILMLILSVAEYVVRREMSKDFATIIGPGNKKLTRPSLIAIFRIFYSVETAAVSINGKLHRGLTEPLMPNVKSVMKYLGIPEEIFIRG